MHDKSEGAAAQWRAAWLRISVLTTAAISLLAFGFTLVLAVSSGGCTADAAAIARATASATAPVSVSASAACAGRGFIAIAPEPLFDSAPITPVESAGASRTE